MAVWGRVKILQNEEQAGREQKSPGLFFISCVGNKGALGIFFILEKMERECFVTIGDLTS